jgi:hypothetical protein
MKLIVFYKTYWCRKKWQNVKTLQAVNPCITGVSCLTISIIVSILSFIILDQSVTFCWIYKLGSLIMWMQDRCMSSWIFIRKTKATMVTIFPGIIFWAGRAEALVSYEQWYCPKKFVSKFLVNCRVKMLCWKS